MTHARLLFVSMLAGVALPLLPGLAIAQSCAPECKVSIQLPPNNQMPVVDHPVVKADPGARIDFALDGPGTVWVIFTNEGKTPFVDRQGNPVYSFNINQLNGQSLQIREIGDGEPNPCAAKQDDEGKEYSDCKYNVAETGNHRRPPLDPYIIIRI